MPSQLYTNEAITFLCARPFTWNGHDYSILDEFPQEEGKGRIEVLVRTRRVIPVVDDYGDKPRHWHREVQLRENVEKKLSGDYRFHRETKPTNDEETRRVGAKAGKVTNVGTGKEYDRANDVAPGELTEWEETEDNSAAIWQAQQDNIDKENEMAEEGKQEATFVDGEEQSEPVEMIGEQARDAEVEVREVDVPENESNIDEVLENQEKESERAESADESGSADTSSQRAENTSDTPTVKSTPTKKSKKK